MVGDGDDSHCRAFESRVGFLGEGALGWQWRKERNGGSTRGCTKKKISQAGRRGGTTTVNKAGDATAQTPPPLPPEPGQGSLPTQTCCAVRGRPLAWASTWTIPAVVLHMSSAQGGGAQTMAIRSRRRLRRHPYRSWRPSRASHGSRPVIGGCQEIRDLGDQRNGGGQATPNQDRGADRGNSPCWCRIAVFSTIEQTQRFMRLAFPSYCLGIPMCWKDSERVESCLWCRDSGTTAFVR